MMDWARGALGLSLLLLPAGGELMADEQALQERVHALEKEIKRLSSQMKSEKYGLRWVECPEAFEEASESGIPIMSKRLCQTPTGRRFWYNMRRRHEMVSRWRENARVGLRAQHRFTSFASNQEEMFSQDFLPGRCHWCRKCLS